MGGQPVHELQEALVKIGAMSATPDGDFGRKTQDAVKRFQWYLINIAFRLRVTGSADSLYGSIETYTKPAGIGSDGFASQPTLAEIVSWRDAGFETTSPLVAYSVGKLSNITLSSTFTVLDYPSPGNDEMLVHQDFVSWLVSMNDKAKANVVSLRVNQAFRVQGLPVSGAVVPPASKSQHLIGHALDVNIVDGTTVNTSAMFIAGTATQAAKDFTKAAKGLGLRWGGDFKEVFQPILLVSSFPPDRTPRKNILLRFTHATNVDTRTTCTNAVFLIGLARKTLQEPFCINMSHHDCSIAIQVKVLE